MATFTGSKRSTMARSIAFCTMSTLSFNVGVILTAASVMMSGSARPGTSITKQ
jgi:hypothetical protein